MACSGSRRRTKGKHGQTALPYPTVELSRLLAMPVSMMAERGCHLWLWTTNQTLTEGLLLMRSWGFTYLAPIHWIKPSGMGNYFVHRTQTLLFGYYQRCSFPLNRYADNVINAPVPSRHSAKPEESYAMIESISPSPRIELFARNRREGWASWGNEIESDIALTV